MPIYDFKCSKCGDVFERIIPMDAEARCGACGIVAEKMVGGSAFVLSGGGWYNDGYGLKESTEKA